MDEGCEKGALTKEEEDGREKKLKLLFQELAIINHSVRCSSVLTQSYTELLAIPDSVSGKKVKVRNDSLKKKL